MLLTPQNQTSSRSNPTTPLASPILSPRLSPHLSPRVSPKKKVIKKTWVEREWISLHPQAGFFSISVDEEKKTLDKDLAALLRLHARGLPLMISFDCFGTASEGHFSPLVVGLFHCLKCLANWKKTNFLSSHCHEVARFVTGPLVTLSLKDAVTLIDVLKFSKRFVSRKLLPILPGLRSTKRDEKIIELFMSILATGTRKKVKSQNTGTVEQIGRQNRNKDLATKTARSFRKRIFASLPEQIPIPMPEKQQRKFASDEITEKIGLLGYKTENNCFYTGFFSRKNFVFSTQAKGFRLTKTTGGVQRPGIDAEHRKQNVIIPSVPPFPFLTRGKFDPEGKHHPYYLEKTTEGLPFPTLEKIVHDQSRELLESSRLTLHDQIQIRKSGILVKNVNEDIEAPFYFCFQNGVKLKLSELLGTGIWHLDQADEFFVGGVFNYEGTFVAAYFISKSGFLIPGMSDNQQHFIPTCRYNFESEVLMMPEKPLHEDILQDLVDIERVVVLPKADDLRIIGQNKWACVKDSKIVPNPLSITILSDAFFGENEDINIYVGGEIGSDGQLYLYGKYRSNGSFVPGALSLNADKDLVELYKDRSVEQNCAKTFQDKYGLELNSLPHVTRSGNRISTKWETQDEINKIEPQEETEQKLTPQPSPKIFHKTSPLPQERKIFIKKDLPKLGSSSLQGTKVAMKGKKKKVESEEEEVSKVNEIPEVKVVAENIPTFEVIQPELSIPISKSSTSNSSNDEHYLLTGIRSYHFSDTEERLTPIQKSFSDRSLVQASREDVEKFSNEV